LVESIDASETPCRVWLAPSHLSTDDKIKFGLFAGVEFGVNETLPNPDIGIPLIDLSASNYLDSNQYELHKETIEYLDNMVWISRIAGAQFEGNATTHIFSPGLGSMANLHSGFSNVDWVHGSVLLREPDDTLEEGKFSPGRGAFTNYYNMTMCATKRIPVGMELFANIGTDTAAETEKGDLFQDRLTRIDYENADKVLDKIIAFMIKYDDHMNDGYLTDEVVDFILDAILEGAGGKRAKVIRSLLPPKLSKLLEVKRVGGAFMYRNKDIVKSLKWLQTHGMCVDNLYPGKSTIPHAGRGAFSSRKIAADEIIAPVPMIPILSEELLDMYAMMEQEGTDGAKTVYDPDIPLGRQIFYNYAHGHIESSLLLVPSSPVVNLINHGSDDQVNAKLAWSTHDHVLNDVSVQDIELDKWDMQYDPRVTMILTATRDIAKGEEIFIDYGTAWVDAWESHVVSFGASHRDGSWPLKAEDVRRQYKNVPYPVNLKKNTIPYPPGVATACFVEMDDVPDGQPRRSADGRELFNWVGSVRYEDFNGNLMDVCDLISREEDPEYFYNYTVATKSKDSDGEVVLVQNVPHAAITLVDKPYTSDIHAKGAFRQWIAIPDELFPLAWRNLRE
jgi:hypothetical protein